jgi:hypothetical protein
MMMLKLNAKAFLCILLLYAGVSCDVDYSLGKLALSEPECIIVNGILTPGKEIEIQLYKLQISDNHYTSTGLEGAKVILKEGQRVLYDDICNDSILQIALFPVENMTYSVEVAYNNMKTIKASTRIPPAITCKAYVRAGNNNIYNPCYLVELNTFKMPQADSISLFVASYAVFEKDNMEDEAPYNEMYTKSAFVDKSNSVGGMPIQHEEVGSIYNDYYLRVKNKNLPHLESLVFLPTMVNTYNLKNSYDTLIVINEYFSYVDDRVWEYQTKINVQVITASLEYDQYCKSFYEQHNSSIMNGDFASVFQPKNVYSNVENGLGIFAGMNATIYPLVLPKKED